MGSLNLFLAFYCFVSGHRFVVGNDLNLDMGGDLMDSLGGFMDTLASLSGDSDCTFKCQNGAVPRPAKNHKPSSNGCGAEALQLDTSELPGMTKCCDKHDKCYDYCGNEKKECDRKFKKCLVDLCDSMKKTLSKKLLEGCDATAELMYQGTTTFGCQSYKDSQNIACDCRYQNTQKNRRKGEL